MTDVLIILGVAFVLCLPVLIFDDDFIPGVIAFIISLIVIPFAFLFGGLALLHRSLTVDKNYFRVVKVDMNRKTFVTHVDGVFVQIDWEDDEEMLRKLDFLVANNPDKDIYLRARIRKDNFKMYGAYGVNVIENKNFGGEREL